MHFLEWKVWYFDSNFTEVCPQGFNWQQASISSGNGLAPNRRQAIIWTNADPIHWSIYAALGRDESKILYWLESRNLREFLHLLSVPTVSFSTTKIYRNIRFVHRKLLFHGPQSDAPRMKDINRYPFLSRSQQPFMASFINKHERCQGVRHRLQRLQNY